MPQGVSDIFFFADALGALCKAADETDLQSFKPWWNTDTG